MHSIELVPDDPVDAAVRADWERLERAGLPSQGRHRGPSNRPHVTLVLTASMGEPVRDRLAGIAGELPLPVALGAPIVFGHRRYILCRLIIPDRALLDLQQRVLAALDEPVDRHGTFRAGGWTPHVTLGRRFGSEQIALALTALGRVTDVAGVASRLRTWDIEAHREHWLNPG